MTGPPGASFATRDIATKPEHPRNPATAGGPALIIASETKGVVVSPTSRKHMESQVIASVEWRKSSHSGGASNACIEFAPLPDGMIAMRNSRDPDGALLVFTRREIAAMMAGVRDGEFDDLAVEMP